MDGMRFVYDQKDESGNEMSLDVIAEVHEELLDSLLEDEKRRLAEDIARKRAAGQNPPLDPLTTEAMVAQAAVHMEEVSRALIEFHEGRRRAKSVRERHGITEQQILSLVDTSPGIKTEQLIALLGMSKSGMYRHLSNLKERGALVCTGKGSGWTKSDLGKSGLT